ncbi:ATP synthase gamma chain [Dictyobacter sp. S3.2.2.5]|uniref:ATP synthase gamma chain n=1 Tax=Dictyobacter halimunensis TaxID=3026934 RepID=A0ABQ6FW45_9CHLR|nr:ATP synthase gamma chain [Dictyobacter sp. S3.2.2.5]
MPSTREIRQRIRSVKNTAKITKAMQMVASSKMRRAQERVEQARPFADQIRELVSRLATAAANGNEDLAEDLALLKQRPVRNIGIVLISPDRGLCGALPSNINRHAALTARNESQRLAEQGRSPGVEYVAVGRKGRDFVVRNELGLVAEFTNYGDRPGISDASAIAQVAVDAFLKGEVDVVYLVYAKFVNTVTQTPVTVQLLPVQPPEKKEEDEQAKDTTEYIYEPDEQTIFKALLPRYVDILVYQAMLEAVASQQSAQMVAMKNATDNANELIQDLTLTYNKVRQAAITTQILEVVAGAEAL